MSKFDESKVINSLHIEEAKIGKKYYFRDNLYDLKVAVENEKVDSIGELTNVGDKYTPFTKNKGACWEFIYPYEEPPKKRMTNRMLLEWLAKGNGMFCNGSSFCYMYTFYSKEELDDEVTQGFKIRTWDSDEWIEPTVDIYERDCK